MFLSYYVQVYISVDIRILTKAWENYLTLYPVVSTNGRATSFIMHLGSVVVYLMDSFAISLSERAELNNLTLDMPTGAGDNITSTGCS